MGIALMSLHVEMIITVLIHVSVLPMLDVRSKITLKFALASHSIAETHMMEAVMKNMVSKNI